MPPKPLKTSWPFVDADGDDVDSVAELRDLYPATTPELLMTLPVSQHMPARLRAEIEALLADPDEVVEVNRAPEAKRLDFDGDGDG